VLKADWVRLSQDYFNVEIARQLFPEILFTALKNTAVYTRSDSLSGSPSDSSWR
jgi:polar amino acid transport system permease protein